LIYPPELEVKETTDTVSSASFLDLYLEFDDSGQLSTKIYEQVLGVELQLDISKVSKITSLRHDIVHRNGYTKDREPIKLTL
jgi:hypothetical protein